MKAVFLSLFLVFTIGTANAAAQFTAEQEIAHLEAELQAKTETINELLSDITGLKSTQHDCDERPPRRPDPVTCVQRCEYRSNGSCIIYGADFCGPNASCVENCTYRSNGSCIIYGADICS